MLKGKILLKKAASVFTAAALALLCAALPAAADDTEDLSMSFAVEYDTYIRKGSANETADYSKTADMIVDGRAGSERIGVLRFKYGAGDAQNAQLLANDISAAFLKVQVSRNTGAPKIVIYGVADDAMKSAFSPVNYKTARDTGILSARDTQKVPRLDGADMEGVSASSYLSFDITDYVKSEAQKAAAGEDAEFIFLICGEDAYSADDYFRIYADNENGTDPARLPMIEAYSGSTGYALRDAMSLNIEKTHGVTEGFSLPAEAGTERSAEYISRIEWQSDNESVISLFQNGDTYEASVTRPPSSQSADAAVTLTARVYNGTQTGEKTFKLLVPPEGVFAPALTNYVNNSSNSTKEQSSPNSVLNTYISGSKKQVAFVSFDTSAGVFTYSPKILLRIKPYYMTGAFSVKLSPLGGDAPQLCTDAMTWNSSSQILSMTSEYETVHEQSPSQTDRIEWDVTDYIHSVGDCAVFRLEIISDGTAQCMMYGNHEKYLPQLKLYNYELVSDPAQAIKAAARELKTALDEMKNTLLQITGDITLPTTDKYGVTVSYSITDEDGAESMYLSSSGALLKRPQYPESDAPVTITARLTREDYAGEDITVTAAGVVQSSVTDEQATELAKEKLTLYSDVLTSSGSLPSGSYETNVAWSAAGSISISGSTYSTQRAKTEKNASITATISRGEAQSAQKSFDVTILRDSAQNLINGRRTTDGEQEKLLITDDNTQTYYSHDGAFSVEYELAAEKKINTALVVPYNRENIEKIDVYAAESGGEYTKCATITPQQSVSTASFKEVNAKRVRFDVKQNGTAGLYEAGVYLCESGEQGQTAADILYADDFLGKVNLSGAVITGDFTLPTALSGAVLSWQSGGSAIKLTDNGSLVNAYVTRASRAQSVVLTVKATLGTDVCERSITVTVAAAPSQSGGRGGGGGIKLSPATPAIGTDNPQPTPDNTQKSAFSDIENVQWAKEAIEELYKRGIVNGKTPSTFEPDSEVKREEFVKMELLALNLTPGGTADFTDAEIGAWYMPYLAAAQQGGLVTGGGDKTFGVGQSVTREDAAVMLMRAMKLTAGTALPFRDAGNISPYAKDAVSALYEKGILQGDENGNMNPKKALSRAEAAKLIYMLLNNVN